MKKIISILTITLFILLTFASSKTMDECYYCKGKGVHECWTCGGDGRWDSNGELDNNSCHDCSNGIQKCTECRGTGKDPL